MLIKRKRKKKRDDDAPDVTMAPLIDCVFLLLIFFMVTTMMKKREKQIPIEMPEMTLRSSVDASPEVHVIAVGTDGSYWTQVQRQTDIGRARYQPIKTDLPDYLELLAADSGLDAPVRVDVPREMRFEQIVQLLDLFQDQGYDNVSTRLLDDSNAGTFLTP